MERKAEGHGPQGRKKISGRGLEEMKIKDLPKVDRPREKLEKYGPERLSDSELLAILLRTGSEGINVVELATKILRKFSG